MKAISIDKPCSENWGAMTPSEQGAFCGKCQIDVVDFSNKTPIEVKLILQENVGKHMCGRFKKTQLDDINLEYTNWETQSLRTFQSKFVYALVVVFGMTLFSCNAPDEMIMGDVDIEHYPTDTISHQDNMDRIEMEGTFSNYGLSNESEIDTTKKQNNEREHIKGKVAYVQEEEIDLDPVDERNYIKGDIAYIPDTVVVAEEPIKDTVVKPVVENPMRYMLGEIYIPEDYKTDTVTTTNNVTPEKDPVVSTCSNTLVANFTASLYPNPTGEVATVLVLIDTEDNFTVELFDISGNKLALIYTGKLSAGRQQFAVAMNNYKNGNYILVVSNSTFKQTLQIQKVD